MKVEQGFTRRGFLKGSAATAGAAGLAALGIRGAEAQTRAPLSSKEITELFTLEEKRFEGALGPRWSDAYQDTVSGNWRRIYDVGILERGDGDGKLSFAPVLKQLWDKGGGPLLESGQYGISLPSPQEVTRSNDPEGDFWRSVSQFSVPDSLWGALAWLRGIAETGPIRTYGLNKQGRTVVATDNIALQESSTGLFFLPVGRAAKTPELELVPSTVEVFPWPERFGDLERDGLEFINVRRKDGKPAKVGLALGDPEQYKDLLWLKDTFGYYPDVKRRIILYESYQRLRDESEVPYDYPHNTIPVPWGNYGIHAPVRDEQGNFIEWKQNFVFKDGEMRWGVGADGVLEFHLSLPEKMPGKTPDIAQLKTVAALSNGTIPWMDIIFSNPDGNRGSDKSWTPERDLRPSFKVGEDRGLSDMSVPFLIIYKD